MSDNPQVASGVREGDVLAGKYRIDEILGAGGMGVVVAAHHIQLDNRVAIKFLLPHALASKEAVARFAREARAAVKIRSEHVARVSDVGTLENGAPYIIMEYLEGSDLSAWLRRMGVLPVEQAVEFILQACEAIAEAHALGIVHRDLKPANLFVVRRPDGTPCVKVLDFGISKATGLGTSGSDLTQTSAVMGSPLYMSPEQMQSSKDADARSDIWALGVIIYELLTATSPFIADTMPELILKIMSATPPPLRDKRPDAPDGLGAVILKCLDKDRGKRFQTVGELALALLPFGPKRSKASVERISGVMMAAGLAGSALVLPPSSDKKDEQRADAGTAAPWSRTTAPKSNGRLALYGVVGAAAVIGIAMTVMRTHKPIAPPVEIGSSVAVGAPPNVRSLEPRAEEAPQKPTAQSPGSAEAAAASGAPSVSRSVPVDPPRAVEPNKPAGKTTKKPGSKEAVAKAALASGESPPVSPPVAPAPPKPTPAQPAHPAQPMDEWGPGRH